MSGVLSVPVGWAKIKAKNKLPTAIKMKTDLANEELSSLLFNAVGPIDTATTNDTVDTYNEQPDPNSSFGTTDTSPEPSTPTSALTAALANLSTAIKKSDLKAKNNQTTKSKPKGVSSKHALGNSTAHKNAISNRSNPFRSDRAPHLDALFLPEEPTTDPTDVSELLNNPQERQGFTNPTPNLNPNGPNPTNASHPPASDSDPSNDVGFAFTKYIASLAARRANLSASHAARWESFWNDASVPLAEREAGFRPSVASWEGFAAAVGMASAEAVRREFELATQQLDGEGDVEMVDGFDGFDGDGFGLVGREGMVLDMQTIEEDEELMMEVERRACEEIGRGFGRGVGSGGVVGEAGGKRIEMVMPELRAGVEVYLDQFPFYA